MIIVSSAYYVPAASARLISPQRLFNADKGVIGKFIVEEHNCTLYFEGVGDLVVDYDSRSHLPIGLAKNHTPRKIEISTKVHLAGVLSDDSTNLSPSRKFLLH